jgi:hypothetical protein
LNRIFKYSCNLILGFVFLSCNQPENKFHNSNFDSTNFHSDTIEKYIHDTIIGLKYYSVTDFIGVWQHDMFEKATAVLFNQDKTFYSIQYVDGSPISNKGVWEFNKDSNCLHFETEDENGFGYSNNLKILSILNDTIKCITYNPLEADDDVVFNFVRSRDKNGQILLYSKAFEYYLKESKTNEIPDRNNNSSNENNKPSYISCDLCNGSGRCSNCNKSFRVHYWDYNIDQWKDRNEMRPGQVMCSTCYGAGVIYGSFQGNLKDPETRPCYINGCQGGWLTCNECNANGSGERIGQCRRCYGKGVLER